MKNEQFRLGNLMMDVNSGTILKIDELSESHVGYYVIDRSKYPLQKGWQAGPIPLTIELLEGLGFMLVTGVYWTLNHLELEEEEPGDFRPSTEGICVNYLHELQNLYYSFTGIELKILI